jgi:hypothetical protein
LRPAEVVPLADTIAAVESRRCSDLAAPDIPDVHPIARAQKELQDAVNTSRDNFRKFDIGLQNCQLTCKMSQANYQSQSLRLCTCWRILASR